MLVCLEGLDASGKHTQASRLSARLQCRLLAFPTYDREAASQAGNIITDRLHGQWKAQWMVAAEPRVSDQATLLDAFVFQCLMSVNKYEMAPTIRAIVDYGGNVVLDRYWQSAYAYGAADGIDKGWLLQVHKQLPQPDLNILLDIDYETSLERRPDRRVRYEKMGKDFFDQLQQNYLDLWWRVASEKKLPGRWHVIDGKKSAADVEAEIWTLASP
jgi:dTMP kinase